MFSCLIAYIVGVVWGRVLPSLWRARCRRVPRKKQVFAWRVCRFSHFGLLRARPKIMENEPKTHDRKQPKCSATRARGRKQKTPSKIVDLGALSSPKSTPGLPKAAQEASGSGWVTTEAESRGQERPRHASKGFRVPLAGKRDFRKRLRVTGFAHPGPLGTDNYQRKAI